MSNFNDQALGGLANLIAQKQSELHNLKEEGPSRDSLLKQIQELKQKLNAKRMANSLSRANQSKLAEGMKPNTSFYSLKGKYKILVIPVQFTDIKFDRPDYLQTDKNGRNPLQESLFGSGANTLRTYYQHQSFGTLDVDGVIAPIVNVSKKLEEYGEAVVGENDKDAQKLVVEALLGVIQKETSSDWWQQFDQWDLQDYDGDGNHYESDGFIDAVVLVYAGKPQSSCQRIFDPNGEKPASKNFPEGPRKKAAVECFNRLWPHRSAIQLAADDPNHKELGPVVEGIKRPSLNGLKITDQIYALDYNMQSEYSDIATFIHEFGHSLTLPDVYATSSAENSTGEWEVMSSTATPYAQELSSWGRLTLGWLSPKIVNPSQHLSSVYLGAMNYLDPERRQDVLGSTSPDYVTEKVDGAEHIYDILSVVPGSDEPVYRSAIVPMPSSQEAIKIMNYREENGQFAVYSGKYDGSSRAIKIKLDVPSQGSAELKLDTVYAIETGTNFDSIEPEIKITTDYDLATVNIDGKEIDRWRLLSGDLNKDSLVEQNPKCEVDRVKELRLKVYGKSASDVESEEFKQKLGVCRIPAWVTNTYDLSAHRGKNIELEIRYTTDPGYTELGVFVDNIVLGGRKIDFESTEQQAQSGAFMVIKDGVQNLSHNQFYIFEYRDPLKDFVSTSAGKALNFDRNIYVGVQGLFLDEGKNSLDKFRVIEGRYQPGVVVWYYNSKYDERSNNPITDNGKGFLLVLNANKKELMLPSVWNKAEWLDTDGYYFDLKKDSPFKNYVEKQRSEYVCFSHTEYYKYLEGVEADCSKHSDTMNALKQLKRDDKSLIYSREFINEVHPLDYDKYFWINRPYSNSAAVYTALSTFRSEEEEAFIPFNTYKVDTKTGGLVIDEEISKQVTRYAAVSSFSDLKHVMPKRKSRWGDNVNVEKKGFSFEVVNPAKHVVNRYSNVENSQRDDFAERRPRVKIYFQMEPVSQQ